MCDKVIIQKIMEHWYLSQIPRRIKKMSNKAADNYAHALEFVSNC